MQSDKRGAKSLVAYSQRLAEKAASLQDLHPEQGLLLNLEALSTADTPEAEQSLKSSLARPFHASKSLSPQIGRITSVAFSPTSTLLAGAGLDGKVQLWDAGSQRSVALLAGFKDAVISLAFSPNDKLLSTAGAALDTTLRLWDVASGQPQGERLTGHGDAVNSVAFSPDGKLLASGSSDNTVQLWDVGSRQPHGAPLSEPTGGFFAVAFIPPPPDLSPLSRIYARF